MTGVARAWRRRGIAEATATGPNRRRSSCAGVWQDSRARRSSGPRLVRAAGLRTDKFGPSFCDLPVAVVASRELRKNRLVAPGLSTPLCHRFGIEYPVLSAGMGQAAGPDLVSAVSNAGGLGVLGLSGTAPAEMRRVIGRTRELTDRPFGVNFVIADQGWATTEEDKQLLRDEVAAAADAGVAVIVLFWGDPLPYVETAHSKGVKLLIQVGSA